jgi:dTDP-4-amino-4,6-dideoxygalactose transaminase
MPEYHCGVEVQAAIDAGLSVRYYRVSRDLSVDEGDLERCLRILPGPVLLIHYFGFAQPGVVRIARRCRELGVTLIEDCAHALFSSLGQVPLGTFGPVSVFSLRKSLPIYDGGALSVTDYPFEALRPLSPSMEPYKFLLKDTIRCILGKRITESIRSMRAAPSDPNPPKPEWEHQAAEYRRGFSLLSRRLASSAEPSAVVDARRLNWQSVHLRLAAYSEHRPVWDGLPIGTCPLFYCFWVRDRDTLMKRLLAEGVETFRFGARPHPSLDLSSYSESGYLRDSILAFPVHQNLDGQALHQALDVLARIRRAP